jgi:hypothetical protein
MVVQMGKDKGCRLIVEAESGERHYHWQCGVCVSFQTEFNAGSPGVCVGLWPSVK